MTRESSAIVIVSRFTILLVFDEPLFEGARIALLEFLYECEGIVVQRDESLIVELSDGDLEEVIFVVIAKDAVIRQRAELSDAYAGFAHQQQALKEDGVGGGESFL